VYILAVAEVIALTELLSVVSGVGRWQYLGLQAPLLAVAAWWWRRSGRPLPPRPDTGWLRRSPIVLALVAVVSVAVAYEALPRRDDSAEHLGLAVLPPAARRRVVPAGGRPVPGTRAHGADERVPAGRRDAGAYVFALARNDLLAELPQWLAQLALLAAVFGIARRAGWRAPAAASQRCSRPPSPRWRFSR
jgi:hypothetical protein